MPTSKTILILLGFMLCMMPLTGHAREGQVSKAQAKYERKIKSVTRNKRYFKDNHWEFTLLGGLTPYDSLVSHLMVGGRALWHLSDHYGWEVVDANFVMPSVTSFSTGLSSSQGLENLQFPKLKLLATTNFIISPFYGKIRFFGSTVRHLDIYFVGGAGAAKVEVTRLSAASQNATPTESIVKSSFVPTLVLGAGFKIFLGDGFALNFDLRDYLIFTELYGNSTTHSNFVITGGISLFLPFFG